jgi:hypothetical protein
MVVQYAFYRDLIPIHTFPENTRDVVVDVDHLERISWVLLFREGGTVAHSCMIWFIHS